jgi:hypothetical protein
MTRAHQHTILLSCMQLIPPPFNTVPTTSCPPCKWPAKAHITHGLYDTGAAADMCKWAALDRRCCVVWCAARQECACFTL